MSSRVREIITICLLEGYKATRRSIGFGARFRSCLHVQACLQPTRDMQPLIACPAARVGIELPIHQLQV